MQNRSVLEYEWIGEGGTFSLSDSQLAQLDHLCKLTKCNFIEWQRNRFRFCGYCGVLQLGELNLEVLPKIYGKEADKGISRNILIRMLAAVSKLELNNMGLASLHLQKHILLDIFILAFAEKLWNTLRHGMLHTYVSQSENSTAVKGKIAIPEQIRHNTAHNERIFCTFDSFQTDNLQNRIIKRTLKCLLDFAQSLTVLQKLEPLYGVFADVQDYLPNDTDWNRITFNRTNQDWEEILTQCRWFLKGMSPDVVSGNATSISLMFSMNTLFEEYIGVELKKAFGEQYDVLLQKPVINLLHNETDQLFRMKPDIFIREIATKKGIAILDTKWKLLNGEERKMGVSQADLYQMYTYAGNYDVDNVALIYPLQSDLSHLDSTWKFADGKKSVSILQIDLGTVIEGRTAFRSALVNLFRKILSQTEIVETGNRSCND